MTQKREVLRMVSNVVVGGKFQTTAFDSTGYRKEVRKTLDEAKCVIPISKGIRGIPNEYKRVDKPRRDDQSICRGCNNIDNCPIYEGAILP